jgi:translation initiation factor 3 subunit B
MSPINPPQDFEWSPAEPLLAAYTVEQNNIPARIQLIKIPERTDVRQKNLFSVSGEAAGLACAL